MDDNTLAPSYSAQIEQVESVLLQQPQIDCPVVHRFAPGCYMREVFMPAGTFVIGHQHKTRHFNIVLSGRARVMIDGVVQEIVAPTIFVSEPGVRKVLYIEEDMQWATAHPTHETDIDRLADELITKSASYLEHERDMKRLKEIISEEEDAK